MWKRTIIGAGLLLGVVGCEEPAPERVEVAPEETYRDFEAADDEYGAETRPGIDTATTEEERPPAGRTDCVALTDPACTTEPTPGAMRDLEAADEAAEEAAAPSAATRARPAPESEPTAPEPELSTVTSRADLQQTSRNVTAALQQLGLEIVAAVSYDASDRGAAPVADAPTTQTDDPGVAAAETTLEGTTGRARPAAIGDVRMIVFRSPEAEGRAIAERGVEALFEAPRTLAVFERGDEVVVAWQRPDPESLGEAGEPLGPELDRVIAEAVVDRSEARERAGLSPEDEQPAAATTPLHHPASATSDTQRSARAPSQPSRDVGDRG